MIFSDEMAIIFMNVYYDDKIALLDCLRVETLTCQPSTLVEDDRRVIDSLSNPCFLDRRNVNVNRSLNYYTSQVLIPTNYVISFSAFNFCTVDVLL